jgi:aspartate ammonia-lyase
MSGTSSADSRTDRDSIGEIDLPADALYGPQTQRAVTNFPLRGQRRLGDFPLFVDALVAVKGAAATANGAQGHLDRDISEAIIAAGDAVRSGAHYDEFPIHHLHGGGGTSANMNANEVLANLASSALGGERGAWHPVHPLRHVNLHQSTNDVVPTASRIAASWAWDACAQDVEGLEEAIAHAIQRFGGIPRLARTCLQDAAAMTFGDLLGGYLSLVKRFRRRIDHAVTESLEVSLGGALVGRAADVPSGYQVMVVAALSSTTGIDGLRRTPDLPDGAQNPDALLEVASALDVAARSLLKIAKDLRLLASGPEFGFCEIRLEAVQPGSSALPAKVNPVIPEHVVQLAMKISALREMASAALEHGELDLNVWEMPMTAAVLEQFELLGSAAAALARCVGGASPDEGRNREHAGATLALLYEVSGREGYEAADNLAVENLGDLGLIRAEILRRHPDLAPPDAKLRD